MDRELADMLVVSRAEWDHAEEILQIRSGALRAVSIELQKSSRIISQLQEENSTLTRKVKELVETVTRDMQETPAPHESRPWKETSKEANWLETKIRQTVEAAKRYILHTIMEQDRMTKQREALWAHADEQQGISQDAESATDSGKVAVQISKPSKESHSDEENKTKGNSSIPGNKLQESGGNDAQRAEKKSERTWAQVVSIGGVKDPELSKGLEEAVEELDTGGQRRDTFESWD